MYYLTEPRAPFGEENGTPPQCSCLENPRDGGAWWAAVCGVAQSWTRLKRLSSSSRAPFWPSLMAQQIKNLPAIQETQEMPVQSLGQEDPLEEENGNLVQYSCLKKKSSGQRSLAGYGL